MIGFRVKILGVLATTFAAFSTGAGQIFEGWYADPQIRRYGDTYWVFPTTSDRFARQVSFDAFSSKDMKTWTKHPRILTTNEVAWAKGAMWAPDAHEVGGKYYLFFSANNAYPVGGKREDGEPQTEAKLQGYGGIGVAVADKPEGPYRDLIGKPLIDRFWNSAQPIDQYVFEYNGEWYMVYGGWGRCNLVKLAKDFKSLVPFEDGVMWRDFTPKDYVEGSVMFERKGKWYFMYSSGSWTKDSYCVNYSVGDTPFGPFEFKGKVLASQKPLATGAGHHSVVCMPGSDDWYICYHRRPIPSEGRDHRVVCIDRMTFDANGDIKPVVMTSAATEAAGLPVRKVVNIVNFVRALDPRRPKSEHLRALREEIALNRKYGFENTILLQYDALVDAEMMAEARKSDTAKTEFGLWFEMSRPLNETAGLEWRPSEKHKGWDWDWFINPGFLMAYDHDGRRKLIDAAFAKFKAKFGTWPKSVGSWLLDAWSMDYMVKTYGVDGFCICREQDSTDAYGLRGGYSNGAYYPSRKNMLSAAVNMENAVRAPVFKMLTPDPIYNYGLPHKLYPGYPHSGGCPTMEPVWYGGHTQEIVDWYFRVYTEPKGLLNLSYIQTGQENAFGWPMISKGLPMQCAKIAAEAAAGRVVVEKMGDTARAFKAAHKSNCPQTQIALEDWTGAGRKSVWYNSRFYRANLFMDGKRLFFRDVHKMSDDFEEPFLDKVCKGWQALYYTPPVVDQWLFRGEDASGTMALSGEFKSIDTAAEGDGVLTVTATRTDGTSAAVRFEEGRIVITGCGLASEYAADFCKTLSVKPGEVGFEFGGYGYRVPVRGEVQATEKGFRVDGDRIELDLSSDGSEVFGGGLWRTFTYDKPSTEPIVFSGESRCEGVTEGQYCIYLDIWYDDGTPVWGRYAEWTQGTHGWEKTMGAFVPNKPVKKIEMHAFLRKGRGKAQFRNLRLERREGNGDVLNVFRRTERPYANQDRILKDVFTGRKIVQQAEKVPVSQPYADNTLATDETVVWTADSMRKVTPLTFPGEKDRKGKPAASISLARRESESFQVQVSTGANVEWREGGVTLPVLRNAKGEAFKGTVEWRRVGYVAREPGYHEHPQGAPKAELWLPDPLLPPAAFRVRKSSTQGLWFAVRAAPDAPAGDYSGDITLTEGGEKRATVHVTVRVEDFSLPETFGMQTAFSVMDGFTRAQYPERFKEKKRESWDVMLDYRLNPDDISRTTPPEIEDLLYARSRGMNCFNILNIVPQPKDPKAKWVCAAPREATEDPAFYPAFKARLEPYVAELKKHGLVKYAYLYGFDERESNYYHGIDVLWKKLKADFLDIPVMTTAMMYKDYAAGKTNLPCLVTTDWYCPLTDVYRKDVSDALRKMGKKVWWYVCCAPNYPNANFASLEYLPIEGRILGWMTHLYRADGLLYWHVNYWGGQCLDERDTFFPSWKTGPIPRMPGDGVLLYPGKDHVLPSIRLAQVRDCVEDYEWLQLAETKGGAEAADAVSRTLIRSMTDFTRDPAQLLEMRARLANVITGCRENNHD